jgi:heme-degrading monooxygenase HmoA
LSRVSFGPSVRPVFRGGLVIAVFVTFDSEDLDDERVRKVAGEARGMFEGMAGLRNKFFTLAEKKDRATNVYVWETEDAARQFFSDQLLERVTGLYGVRPQIEFAEIIEMVDNS